MQKGQTMLQKLIVALAIVALLTGAALAQFPAPSISLEQQKHRSAEQIEKDKEIDSAYRSATKKIPDQSVVNDPWADIRPGPTTAAQNKKQQ